MKILNRTATLLLCASLASVYGALLPEATKIRQRLGNFSAPDDALPSTFDLKVPGTKTTITFSNYAKLLSQVELDLCVIEGFSQAFDVVLSTKRDSFLVRNKFVQRYGEVEILVYDYSQPAFRMTYRIVANMLRGIALFMSMYGYFEVTVGVFDAETGHVGAGSRDWAVDMVRNNYFHQLHEPFESQDSVQLIPALTTGPVSFWNPTRAHFKHTAPKLPPNSNNNEPALSSNRDRVTASEDEQPASNIELKWRSRDNRKGRHVLVTERSFLKSAVLTPKPTSTLRATWQGILRMLTWYPYWDVSYLVATIFTLGSLVWVVNAFFAYLPLAQPQTEFDTEILYAGGITAFLGATIFEIGSILLMFEAVNENRTGCFGWAVERLVEGDGEKAAKVRVRPDKDGCSHHHTNKRNLVGKRDVEPSPSSLAMTSSVSLNGFITDQPKQAEYISDEGRSWVWFPSPQELNSHYLRELGFLACLAQLIGATVFWISGFTALPGINNKLGSQGLLDGIFWVPQIVGGTGFIISGTLFMLETQSKWYIPAFGVLGWHIGFWNLVGAFGFTLCGALGPDYGNSGAEYESSLATFWGSWAFLIGSVIQWYESLDKHPVETKDNRSAPK